MSVPAPESTSTERRGYFASFGGRYVSELLIPALDELDTACRELLPNARFRAELDAELARWAGRPTAMTKLPRLSQKCGLEVVAKREDLLHGGAHKTNNVVGQGLLAKHMGKKRLIAETGAGQHGVATAMAGARLGLEVDVYMGARDAERQAMNVKRMELCGARVIRVASGSATLKDAINEALRDWAESLEQTHYLLGTVCGPAPFPTLVGELQAVIGREARAQYLARFGVLPDAVAACVGGGSNAIGLFAGFVDDPDVALVGIEAAGQGIESLRHAATMHRGRAGLLHGARSLVLQDDDGQVLATHSMAAGLDYPGVSPAHAALQESGRARYALCDDHGALRAFEALSRLEGIIPAFESSHALGWLLDAVADGEIAEGSRVLVNLSGRGDKDLESYLTMQADAAEREARP